MNKPKILISIHSQWCEKIFNREKRIEVRKDRPKIDTPFEALVYCTKGKPYLYRNPNNGELFLDSNGGYRGGDYEDRYLTGKVIGSFVCDEVYDLFSWGSGVGCADKDDKLLAADRVVKETCLSEEQIIAYLENGKGTFEGSGWHFTEPKLFDRPRELSEFRPPCPHPKDGCEHCLTYGKPWGWTFDEQIGKITCTRRITRAPQSWCYVEGV